MKPSTYNYQNLHKQINFSLFKSYGEIWRTLTDFHFHSY